jgi:hypothetical protein
MEIFTLGMMVIGKTKLDDSFFRECYWTFALVIYAYLTARQVNPSNEKKASIRQYTRYYLLSAIREMIHRTIDDQFIVELSVILASWNPRSSWDELTHILNTAPPIRGWFVLREWLDDHTGQILTPELYDELNKVMHTPKEKSSADGEFVPSNSKIKK